MIRAAVAGTSSQFFEHLGGVSDTEIGDEFTGGLAADRLEDVGSVLRGCAGDGDPLVGVLLEVVLDLVRFTSREQPKLARKFSWSQQPPSHGYVPLLISRSR